MANEKRGGGWLKSILIKEDEKTAEQPRNEGIKYNFPSIGTTAVASQPVPSVESEAPDQAYLDHLYKFMEDQNIPGPDYFEYANTLYEMSQMAGSIPEQNLFQLAYVSLKTQGVTPEFLAQSAKKYVTLFEKHKQEFESVLSQEINKSVGAKQQENEALESNNKQAELEMTRLQQQIQTLKEQMVTNTQRIVDNNNFIQSENRKRDIKKAKFEKAYQIVVDKVNGDIQKIQNYVK